MTEAEYSGEVSHAIAASNPSAHRARDFEQEDIQPLPIERTFSPELPPSTEGSSPGVGVVTRAVTSTIKSVVEDCLPKLSPSARPHSFRSSSRDKETPGLLAGNTTRPSDLSSVPGTSTSDQGGDPSFSGDGASSNAPHTQASVSLGTAAQPPRTDQMSYIALNTSAGNHSKPGDRAILSSASDRASQRWLTQGQGLYDVGLADSAVNG
ncbi:hypothetical protein IAU59_006965 [Kwoniella sp. CBS 9459]